MDKQTVYLTSLLVLFVTCTSGFEIKPNLNYNPPETKYFMQRLDHFNPTIDTRFKQKYLISMQYWDNSSGPIFFYTGNEGDIETFANNTGFMWDIAPMFKAIVVFAEHRYYGDSSPYPGTSPSPETVDKFGQFTADQALADYAELIEFLKNSISGASKSRVVVFGGSYGGMLAAWFRLKYPNVVDGAIAASAPVAFFLPLITCEDFNKAVTGSFANVPNGNQCVKTIRNSYNVLQSVGKTDLGFISKAFNLCSELNNTNEIDTLQNWMESGWGNMAMGNYPYPTSFLNSMPGWPVKVTCGRLADPPTSEKDAILKLASAAQVFFNYTGNVKCLDLSQEIVAGLSGFLWSFQTCTEFPMPFCANGVDDMFHPYGWSIQNFTKSCQNQFGTTPRPQWPITDFGGLDVKAGSNIVFSNGDLDPWRVGGIFKSYSDSIITVLIAQGAHHLDLRHTNTKDPPSVIDARKLEVYAIMEWLARK